MIGFIKKLALKAKKWLLKDIERTLEGNLELLKFQMAESHFSTLTKSLKALDFTPDDLSAFEYKVYSQWGHDGIIIMLIKYLKIKTPTFIEFGVQDYTESNTRFLLRYLNWRGLIIDGSKEYMDNVRKQSVSDMYNLTAVCSFITKDNINQTFTDNGFKGEIGLLSIDIDGNDYYVWDAISVVNPIIVVIEYNSLFGPDRAITIPYKADFYRTEAHYSNLYWGASIQALYQLGTSKGYTLVYGNQHGTDLFFVRNDKLSGLKPKIPSEVYKKCMFRQSRDKNGALTLLDFDQSVALIRKLDVFNIQTEQIEIF